MRGIAAFVFACLLPACAGARVEPGPAPAPNPVLPEFRVVSHVSGTGSVQSFVGAVPFSAFFKWTGNGTIEARVGATGVVLYLDGDSTWTVTPAPGLEPEAVRAIEEGRVVIRRNGQPASLVYPSFRPSPEPVVASGEDPCDDPRSCRVPR